MIESARTAEPPVSAGGGANYEGEYDSSLEDVQRYLFWMSMLSGAMRHMRRAGRGARLGVVYLSGTRD